MGWLPSRRGGLAEAEPALGRWLEVRAARSQRGVALVGRSDWTHVSFVVCWRTVGLAIPACQGDCGVA